MTDTKGQMVATESSAAGDAEAIRYFKESIASGKNWYKSLLEAIGLWSSAKEDYKDRTYVYLIDGEAFDWLLLAERLCGTVEELLPENEMDALLFHGVPPTKLDAGEIKGLISNKKYRQYLNFFYGVTVEEALVLAVQESIEKEMWGLGLGKVHSTSNEAYQRIYNMAKDELLKQFRKEKHHPQRQSISLDEMKEFTYWLFKYRLKRCEKARIASDTKKALDYLKNQWRQKGASQTLAADFYITYPD
jgi:hypothetical protein